MKSDCHNAPVIPFIIWLDKGTQDSSEGWYCKACGRQCNVYNEEQHCGNCYYYKPIDEIWGKCFIKKQNYTEDVAKATWWGCRFYKPSKSKKEPQNER